MLFLLICGRNDVVGLVLILALALVLVLMLMLILTLILTLISISISISPLITVSHQSSVLVALYRCPLPPVKEKHGEKRRMPGPVPFADDTPLLLDTHSLAYIHWEVGNRYPKIKDRQGANDPVSTYQQACVRRRV